MKQDLNTKSWSSRLLAAAAILFLLLTAVMTAKAQKRDLSDVRAVERGNGPLMQGDEVVGYFFLYAVGKEKKGEYVMVLTDADMEPIQRIEMEAPTSARAVRGYFNGTATCILLLNFSELYLYSFSAEGEALGNVTLDSKPDFLMRHFHLEECIGEGATALVTSVPNKGFVFYRPWLKPGQEEYTVRFLPNDLDEDRGWDFESDKGRGIQMRRAVTLTADEDLIVTRIISRIKGSHTNRIEVREVDDGKLRYAYTPKWGTETMRIEEAFLEADGQVVVAGTLFPEEADQYEGDGMGIALARLDRDGEELSHETFGWSAVATEMGGAAEEHFAADGQMRIHRVVRQAEGGYVFVGESYRLGEDVGYAKEIRLDNKRSRKLARKPAPVTWEAYQDFAAIRLGEDFKLAGAQTFYGQRTKPTWMERKTVFIPGSTDPSFITFGDTYHYGQSAPGNEGYVFSYYRYPDKKKGSRELVVVTDYGDGEGGFEKVFRPSEGASDSRYIMAKPGYVLVNESFKDGSKAPVLRLEPVD